MKELLYQSEILAFIPAAEAMAPRAQNLSSQLGAHHDLSLLCERLSLSLPGSHAEKVARSRKDALSERALEIGRELLATKPSRLQVDQ